VLSLRRSSYGGEDEGEWAWQIHFGKSILLRHDPEKWKPVFRKDHASSNNTWSRNRFGLKRLRSNGFIDRGRATSIPWTPASCGKNSQKPAAT
jgi:hypothetical protein